MTKRHRPPHRVPRVLCELDRALTAAVADPERTQTELAAIHAALTTEQASELSAITRPKMILAGRGRRSESCEQMDQASVTVPCTPDDRSADASMDVSQTSERGNALLDEGRRQLKEACTGSQAQRHRTARGVSDFLNDAMHALQDGHLDPAGYARILRAGGLIYHMARLPELTPEPLVIDLLAHTVQYGLAAHNAAAQALRGTIVLFNGSISEALDAAVDAMITIELLDEHAMERALATCDTAALLDSLSLPEIAADMYRQAATEFAAIDMPDYQVMMLADQVRTQLEHGLWLERTGQVEAGAAQFTTAAELAKHALRIWQASADLNIDEAFVASCYAAIALANPTNDHEGILRQHADRIAVVGQIVARLALIRVLAATGRPGEAIHMLTDLRATSQRFQLSLPLQLALARGIPELRQAHEPSSDASYLSLLEAQLWVVHQARISTLQARLEHERLRRSRSPRGALPVNDPVTGLPNRTVLTELFNSLCRPARPAALAMVDLDNLAEINQHSCAYGETVLRAIAVTICQTVTPDDAVIRYGADEFIVLLPNRVLHAAVTLMRDLVIRVANLPYSRGHGATISVGVIDIHEEEGCDWALARAEDATRLARARGGNQVTTPTPRALPRSTRAGSDDQTETSG
jgi:diguanylate cyclase (GGDEF)-like protein